MIRLMRIASQHMEKRLDTSVCCILCDDGLMLFCSLKSTPLLSACGNHWALSFSALEVAVVLNQLQRVLIFRGNKPIFQEKQTAMTLGRRQDLFSFPRESRRLGGNGPGLLARVKEPPITAGA